MCKSKLVAVVGPTGSGKTELGALISQRYRGVILSADSRQVYRGLDVGTNKQGLPGFWHGATARFLGATPQLLLDLVEPGTRFTLADWLRAAGAALSEVRAQNYLPVVVGGTGLYVSALISGWTLDERKIGAPVADDYLILERTSDRTNLYDQADQRCQQIFDSLVAECRQLIERGVAASWLAHLGLDYRQAISICDSCLYSPSTNLVASSRTSDKGRNG